MARPGPRAGRRGPPGWGVQRAIRTAPGCPRQTRRKQGGGCCRSRRRPAGADVRQGARLRSAGIVAKVGIHPSEPDPPKDEDGCSGRRFLRCRTSCSIVPQPATGGCRAGGISAESPRAVRAALSGGQGGAARAYAGTVHTAGCGKPPDPAAAALVDTSQSGHYGARRFSRVAVGTHNVCLRFL